MVRKITLVLRDLSPISSNGYVVKSIINSVRWNIGEFLAKEKVEEILQNCPWITVKIEGRK